MNENPKHRRIAQIIVFSAFFLFIMFVCTRENEVPETPKHIIIERDLNSEQNMFKVETPILYNKTQLNLVSRHLKYDWSLQGSKQIYFFYLPVNHESPYAAVDYLPNCETCGKDVDVDGEKYEVRYINR